MILIADLPPMTAVYADIMKTLTENRTRGVTCGSRFVIEDDDGDPIFEIEVETEF